MKKEIIHMMTNLTFDISSANFYLLNRIDVRIRLYFASPELIINPVTGEKPYDKSPKVKRSPVKS